MFAVEASTVIQIINSFAAAAAIVIGAVAVALARRSDKHNEWQSARAAERLQAGDQEHDHLREVLADLTEHLRVSRTREAELFQRMAAVELREEQCQRQLNQFSRWSQAMAGYSIRLKALVEDLGGKPPDPPDPPGS